LILYILDALLRRERIIDRFESCIWTERYQEEGDFELVINSTLETRTLLRNGVLLAMDKSYRVMRIESVEDKVTDGKQLLTIKGYSLEVVLEDRVAKNSTANLTTSPNWSITGTPAAVARKIFKDICVTGILDVYDKIPFITEGTFLPASTIVEPIDPITVELEPVSVLSAIKQICSVWNLGFRLLRQSDSPSKLWFDIYTGSDRTTSQKVHPAVVFDPALDNLQNTTELTAIAGSKNVAYVYSPVGFAKVYPIGVDPEITGFERRVLVVVASDITEETADIPSALAQRGQEELANYRVLQAFDGEISINSQYEYGRDYILGDLVEKRNSDGLTNVMRVVEQIFVSDREGERTYPTLALNTFITTGSWLSWPNNKVWTEYGTTEYWNDQP
jgi:hypothetical protein